MFKVLPHVNIPNAVIPNAIIPNAFWYFRSMIRLQISRRYYQEVLTHLMAMAMSQWPVGLHMKLSQLNMGLNYPLDYVKAYV